MSRLVCTGINYYEQKVRKKNVNILKTEICFMNPIHLIF